MRESWKANCVQLAGLDLLLGTPAEQARAAAAAARSEAALPSASHATTLQAGTSARQCDLLCKPVFLTCTFKHCNNHLQ